MALMIMSILSVIHIRPMLLLLHWLIQMTGSAMSIMRAMTSRVTQVKPPFSSSSFLGDV